MHNYIKIDCHFIHNLQFCSINTEDQTIDIFAKPLLPRRFSLLGFKLKLVYTKSS